MMSRQSEQERHRLKSVCCRQWGISPAEFERQASSGDFTFADAYELITQLETVGSEAVLQYVFREKVDEHRKILQQNEAFLKLIAMVERQEDG